MLRGDAMLGKLVLPEIRELIEAGEDATLREVVNNGLAPDLGEVVSRLEPDEKVKVLRLLEPSPAARRSNTWTWKPSLQSSPRFPIPNLPSSSTRWRPTTARRSGRTFARPGGTAARPARSRTACRGASLLMYGEDSVGRLMTPDYVSVRKDWTIRQALDHVPHSRTRTARR